MSSEWNGEEWLESLRERFANGVTKAADTLAQALTEKVSTPGPPRSKPLEAPHIDTNALHGGMTFQPAGDEPDPQARSGTDRPYGIYLENGTYRMSPRPWLLNTLLDNKDQIKADVLSE